MKRRRVWVGVGLVLVAVVAVVVVRMLTARPGTEVPFEFIGATAEPGSVEVVQHFKNDTLEAWSIEFRGDHEKVFAAALSELPKQGWHHEVPVPDGVMDDWSGIL